MDRRWGLTLPLAGVSLADTGELGKRAEAAGYTDVWSGETAGPDGFTPLTLSAAHTERVRLGTGIVGVFQRGPALLAQDEDHARRVADLQIYLRQHHAERDQASLGELLMDELPPW